LADNYPNSGSLNKALNNFDKDLGHKIKNKRVARCIFFITQKPKIKEEFKENYSMLVSILVDIALKNPKINLMPCSASKLINFTNLVSASFILRLATSAISFILRLATSAILCSHK
jgi:hypothetical protein